MLECDEYGNYYRKIERKVLNRLSLHNLIAEVNKLNKEHLFQVPDIRVEVATPLSEMEIGCSFGPSRRREIIEIKCFGLEKVESFSHGGPVSDIKQVCDNCIFQYYDEGIERFFKN